MRWMVFVLVAGVALAGAVASMAPTSEQADGEAASRAAGAEVVVGDLLKPADVYRIVSSCRRAYFGMSVSAGYLEATVSMAAKGR